MSVPLWMLWALAPHYTTIYLNLPTPHINYVTAFILMQTHLL